METRVALLSIIVKDVDSADQVNGHLHDYGAYVIGRMGIPYRDKGISIISVALDAPQDVINTLAGKIGNLEGVTARTMYSDIK